MADINIYKFSWKKIFFQSESSLRQFCCVSAYTGLSERSCIIIIIIIIMIIIIIIVIILLFFLLYIFQQQKFILNILIIGVNLTG